MMCEAHTSTTSWNLGPQRASSHRDSPQGLPATNWVLDEYLSNCSQKPKVPKNSASQTVTYVEGTWEFLLKYRWIQEGWGGAYGLLGATATDPWSILQGARS